MTTENIQPTGEKMRAAIRWISELVSSCPEKSRQAILREVELKFDLSPKECTFLDTKLSEQLHRCDND